MPGERTVVGAKCQRNSGECTGMQGNARETYGSECKVTGMQVNNRGIYGIGCKVLGEYRGMQGNSRGMYRSGCKVPGECMGVGAKYHGEWSGCKVQGNAGEC